MPEAMTSERRQAIQTLQSLMAEARRREVERERTQRRQVGLAASPIPETLQPVAQPVLRGAARFAEKLSESALAYSEELTNASIKLSNFLAGTLLGGDTAEPISLPPVGIVQHLEKQNILVESNRLERLVGDAMETAAFVAPLGITGKAAALRGLTRAGADMFTLAMATAMEGRRHERLTGQKFTTEDYLKNGFIAAASVPVSMIGGQITVSALSKMIGRPLGKFAQKAATDVALGAMFEGVPQAMAGDFDADKMGSSIIGFGVGGALAGLFGGRLSPSTRADAERSLEISAKVTDELKLGTDARSGKLSPETIRDMQVQQARNRYKNATVTISGGKRKISPSALEQMGAELGVDAATMHGIAREKFDPAEVVKTKLNTVAAELARKSGGDVYNETLYARDLMGPVDRAKWEQTRKTRPQVEPITDEEVFQALKARPELFELVEGEQPRAMESRREIPGEQIAEPRKRTTRIQTFESGREAVRARDELVKRFGQTVDVALKPRRVGSRYVYDLETTKTFPGGPEFPLARREAPGALVPARREVTGKLFPGSTERAPSGVTSVWKKTINPVKTLAMAKRGMEILRKKNPGVDYRIVRTPEGFVVQDRTARVTVQPSPEELMRRPVTPKALPQRIPRRPPPSTGEVIVPPAKEELVGGKGYAETIPTGVMEPALWAPVGEQAKTPTAAKSKLTVLSKANPNTKYRISPENPLVIEKELRPARELTQSEVAEKRNLEQRPVDREGLLAKKYSSQADAEAAIAKLKEQNPNRSFIVRPESKKSVLKIIVPMPVRKPKRVAQQTVRIGYKESKPKRQVAPQPEKETVTQPPRKEPPAEPATQTLKPKPGLPLGSAADVRKYKAALREAARKPSDAPRMKDLVDQYYDAKTRGREGRPESEVRAEMGLVEKGPYKGQSKWFLANKMIWQREWKRYGRQGQKFVRFLEQAPPEFFGGQEAKDAFVAEVRGVAPETAGTRPRALVFAVRTKSGKVISDPAARFHVEVITNKDVNPDAIRDTGFIFEGKYKPGNPRFEGGDVVAVTPAAPTPEWAAGKPGTTWKEAVAATKATAKAAEAALPEVREIRPQEGSASRPLGRVVEAPQAPLPPPSDRVARALAVADRFLESRVEAIATGYDRLTPAEKARVDKTLDRLEMDRHQRAQAEEAIIEADIEIGKELETRGALMPDWRPWKALPLLLAGAGLGYAISRGTTEDDDEAAPLAAAGFFLLGFGKGKFPPRPGKVRPDPIAKWDEAIIRERAKEKTTPIPPTKPKQMPKGAAEEIEKANDAAMEFGARGIDEAMEKLMDPPPRERQDIKKHDLLQFAVRAVGNALSKYGEPGKLLVDLGQRMLSSATREYRVMMHDLSSISDLRFDRPLSKIKQRIHGESDYENLHLIAEQIAGRNAGQKITIDAPNNDKVAALVSVIGRQYGLSVEGLEKLGIEFSPKAKAESKKLLQWVDDHLSHVKDDALANMMAFSPWQKSVYYPGVFAEHIFGPSLNDRFRPDYKAKRERMLRLRDLAAEEIARNNNITFDEAYQVIGDHGNRRGREPMFQAGLKETRVGAPASQHLDHHRMMDTRVGVEYDVARMVEKYSRPAIIRLAFARNFGPRGERASFLIDKAAKMGFDSDQMTSLFDILTMQGNKAIFANRFPMLHRMLGEAGGFTSLKLLGSAGLSQITAGFRIPLEVDYKSTAKAFVPAIQAQLYQSAHVPNFIKQRLASERWARFIAETGPAGQAELVEAMLEMKGVFPKAAALMLRYNMTTPIDRFLRNMAAIGGRMYTDSVLVEHATNVRAQRAGAKNTENMKLTKARITRLFGQDKAMLEEILRGDYSIARNSKGIFSSPRTRLYEIVGGEIVGNRTQGRLLPADLPAYATDPLLAQLYKLQSFNLRTAADNVRMFNPKDPTSIWHSRSDALKVVAALVAGTGVSHGLIYLKRKMRGSEEDWINLPIVQRIADSAAFYGFFSPFYDMWDMSRYGKPSQSMLGPTMQQVFQATDATYASVRAGEVDPSMRFILQSIPIGFWNYAGVPTGHEWAKELFPASKSEGRSQSRQGQRGR